MAIGQNIGTAISAFLPALFTAVAPPGSKNIPLTIGSITLGVAVIAAIAAFSARETYRLRLNDLGNPAAVPGDEVVHDLAVSRQLAQSLDLIFAHEARVARHIGREDGDKATLGTLWPCSHRQPRSSKLNRHGGRGIEGRPGSICAAARRSC